MKSLTPYLQQLIVESSLPLKSVEADFAIDSSGFSTCQFVRWFDVKYGNDEDWHDWIKMHLICGVKTNIVTGMEIYLPAHELKRFYEFMGKAGMELCSLSDAGKGPHMTTDFQGLGE